MREWDGKIVSAKLCVARMESNENERVSEKIASLVVYVYIESDKND